MFIVKLMFIDTCLKEILFRSSVKFIWMAILKLQLMYINNAIAL